MTIYKILHHVQAFGTDEELLSVTLDRRSPIGSASPVTEVVAAYRAQKTNNKNDRKFKLFLSHQEARQKHYRFLRHRNSNTAEDDNEKMAEYPQWPMSCVKSGIKLLAPVAVRGKYREITDDDSDYVTPENNHALADSCKAIVP